MPVIPLWAPALAAHSIGFLSRSPGSYSGWGWIAGTMCCACGEGGGQEKNKKIKKDKSAIFHLTFEPECEQRLQETWPELLELRPSRGHCAQQQSLQRWVEALTCAGPLHHTCWMDRCSRKIHEAMYSHRSPLLATLPTWKASVCGGSAFLYWLGWPNTKMAEVTYSPCTQTVCSIMIFYMMNSVLNGPISGQEVSSHVRVTPQMVRSHK